MIKSSLRIAGMFVSGPLLKLDANIKIDRRDQGYARNQHVSTFAEVSDNLWHASTISGGSPRQDVSGISLSSRNESHMGDSQ
jgi:hypothetical protein